VQSFWTRPEGPGPRLPDTPLFVLCSARTFSAGEEFAYDLQALRRATIVGETSRGGANPGRVHRLDEHFAAFIPDARAINPVTGDNWEGRGVRPDVACAADQALGRAHRLALEALLPGLERDPALAALRDEARQALASLPSPAS
jgi:C-terminal processing protease CtpA/Prc